MTVATGSVLRTGQRVEVKSAAEIAAMLDENGRLDGMPFMPEMASFCGARLVVSRRADKTCVEGFLGMRDLGKAVLLGGARCNGAAHDGCQRNCQIFWHEAWLRPVAGEGASVAPDLRAETRARALLESLPAKRGGRYDCQSTALAEITRPRSKLAVGHLLADVKNGELSPIGFLRMFGRTVINRLRGLAGLLDLGALSGGGLAQDKGDLGLKAGEWVRIKPADAISATLDAKGYNQGLAFEPEMSRYVGGVHQVDFPIRRIILEETGKMVRLTGTVALKELNCSGVCAKNCPRANTLYWRESWLERVENVGADEDRRTA